MSTDIRQPAVAGAFYPGSPSDLAKMIAGMMAETPRPAIDGDIRGIIVPHAGYIYSGPVAAHAFKALQGLDFSDVIVISPCHVEAFPGAAVFPGEAYRTPLGDIPINRQLSTQIAGNSDIVKLSDSGHRLTSRGGEHSLEVELPFLQTVLGKFNLVAIVMGSQDKQTCEGLAKAIADACKNSDDILLVASSDLSHFYDYQTANSLDIQIVDFVNGFRYDELLDGLASHKVEACGGGPMATVMMACEMVGAKTAKVVNHANSGDTSGERSRVVGYLSAVISTGAGDAKVYEINMEEETEIEHNNASAADFGLTDIQKRSLINLAYEAIQTELNGGSLNLEKADYTGVLAEERGAFVTLTIDGELRGCIGYIKAVKPLYETIAEMAVSAAFNDPRFQPLTKSEFSQIDIEISVLTPMILENDPKNVTVGRDGLYIVYGYNSGLLLPQVPVEHNWDRETFLKQTCLKAGLPPDTWRKSGSQLYRFQADIFGGE